MSTVTILPIFIGLMKKQLSHIFRLATISVLMAGLLAHLVLPFSSDAQKTAFTQWLDHKVVASGSENEIKLRNTIRELPENSGDFWVLVEQASELIANHKDDFRFDFSFSDEENRHVKSWLVGQWNLFHYQKSATNAVIPELSQLNFKWVSLSNTFHSFLSAKTDFTAYSNSFISNLNIDRVIDRTIIPLVNEISINAP